MKPDAAPAQLSLLLLIDGTAAPPDSCAGVPAQLSAQGRRGSGPAVAIVPTEAEIDRAFAEWWRAYPRKEARKDARVAFGKIIKSASATVQQLTEGLARYVEHVTRTGKSREFICLPATWLRGERWADEYSAEIHPRGRTAQAAGFARAAGLIRGAGRV